MSAPQIEPQLENIIRIETVEVKLRSQFHLIEDSMSEWELSRLTSKTWSMEQD